MPENTMPAFEYAVGLGYKYLETDVHTTADGTLVAFHDDVLDRVTDRTGAIAALSWDQVRHARVSGQPIPLLEEMLTTWPDVRVNIDAKSDGAVEPLIEVLKRTKSFDRVCVGAFADRRLTRFRRLTEGRVCTSMGPIEIARLRAASFHLPVGRLAGSCSQVPVYHGRVLVVDERFLLAAHRRSVPVHIWTVDEADEMERLLDLGVDGIMSDRPAVLKEVLVRRGQWF
jgi:glycerophosphoryl diester phosphodiesterase